MEWIRSNILFPKKIITVVITSEILEKYHLRWVGFSTLTDAQYCQFLEGLFLYLKENNLIPKDSQLWAGGRKCDTMGIYLTISSENFCPVIDGEPIPCIRLDILRQKE